jgi:hypothetical protein
MVAIVRKVYNRSSVPRLGVLAPEVRESSSKFFLYCVYIESFSCSVLMFQKVKTSPLCQCPIGRVLIINVKKVLRYFLVFSFSADTKCRLCPGPVMSSFKI